MDSPEDRARVRARIAGRILEFYQAKRKHPAFNMQDLEEFVRLEFIVAPGSPCRILRMLRQEGLLDYTVTDRSNSAYIFHYQD